MANPRSNISDKSLLREAMRERLRGMSRGERRERSIQICESLKTFFPGKNSIALFAPKEIEPNLDLLWELGSLEHHLVSYPRCDGETLSFRTVSDALGSLSREIRYSRTCRRGKSGTLRPHCCSWVGIYSRWEPPRSRRRVLRPISFNDSRVRG